MTALGIKLLIGAAIGALLGYFGQCSSGSCPLTANWKRGALYGAALGLVLHLATGGAGGSYPAPKNVKPIAESDFEAEVLAAGKPVLVDIYASWCGPCKTLAPRLDQVAAEFGDRIKFVSLNLDEARTLAADLKVQGVPTLLFYRADGRQAGASVGLVSAEALRAQLRSLLQVQNNSTNTPVKQDTEPPDPV